MRWRLTEKGSRACVKREINSRHKENFLHHKTLNKNPKQLAEATCRDDWWTNVRCLVPTAGGQVAVIDSLKLWFEKMNFKIVRQLHAKLRRITSKL